MTVIGNRAIVEETPLYTLYGADNTITPGFVEMVPHLAGNKRLWALKVQAHLKAFSDPINVTGTPKEREDQITYQPTHRYSYEYRGGSVAVIPEQGRVEIQTTHPERDKVVHGLIKLLLMSRSQRMHSPSLMGVVPDENVV